MLTGNETIDRKELKLVERKNLELITKQPPKNKKIASTMPRENRWGAQTFDEKVQSDMVLNQINDRNRPSPKKNFLEINVKNATVHSALEGISIENEHLKSLSPQ